MARPATAAVHSFVRARPRLYQAVRAGRLWLGRHALRPRLVPGVPGRVHPNDLMMDRAGARAADGYIHAGRQAADLVSDGLRRAGRTSHDVDAALDFGCGYGRVLRYVVQDIEPRRIWASDVDIDAVGFCASEFGVHPLFPTDSIAALMLSGFDLVYAFSVLTHLPESEGTDLLSFFGRALVPGGVIVFTTHGRTSLARIDAYGEWCASDAPAIAEEMTDRGFSFRPYPHYRGATYGMAWHDPDYVRAAAARQTAGTLELVHFGENALDGHQDVYVFRRA